MLSGAQHKWWNMVIVFIIWVATCSVALLWVCTFMNNSVKFTWTAAQPCFRQAAWFHFYVGTYQESEQNRMRKTAKAGSDTRNSITTHGKVLILEKTCSDMSRFVWMWIKVCKWKCTLSFSGDWCDSCPHPHTPVWPLGLCSAGGAVGFT